MTRPFWANRRPSAWAPPSADIQSPGEPYRIVACRASSSSSRRRRSSNDARSRSMASSWRPSSTTRTSSSCAAWSAAADCAWLSAAASAAPAPPSPAATAPSEATGAGGPSFCANDARGISSNATATPAGANRRRASRHAWPRISAASGACRRSRGARELRQRDLPEARGRGIASVLAHEHNHERGAQHDRDHADELRGRQHTHVSALVVIAHDLDERTHDAVAEHPAEEHLAREPPVLADEHEQPKERQAHERLVELRRVHGVRPVRGLRQAEVTYVVLPGRAALRRERARPREPDGPRQIRARAEVATEQEAADARDGRAQHDRGRAHVGPAQHLDAALAAAVPAREE